eukprot:scaffold23077_cov68-Phaeocystis_antarctica.AAC.4
MSIYDYATSCAAPFMSSSGRRRRASTLTTGSAPGAMAGAVPFSLGTAPDGTAGSQAPRLIAAAARPAAACPSGDRATHNAASSAVAKLPRCTSLPPRLICTWKGLGRPGLERITPK